MKFEEMKINEVRTVHDVPKPGATDRNEVTRQFRAADGFTFEHAPPGILIKHEKSGASKWVHCVCLMWVDPEMPKPLQSTKGNRP